MVIEAAVSTADPGGRAAAFRILEALADPRALNPALRAIADPDAAVAIAATGVARVFVRGARGAAAVDALAAAALDRGRPDTARLAALRALADLDPATIAPVLTTLADDPSASVRGAADAQRTRRRAADDNPGEILSRAAAQGLPDDPATLRHALVLAGNEGDLTLLLRIVERVRDREAQEPADRRREWMTVRAATHVALADRGSRLALYDLRESLEAADAPLPVEFLAAVSLMGDASCLESIAGAYARSAGSGRSQHDWWRQHLAEAFRTIAARERLTRRHGVMKRIEKRWPGAFAEMARG